MGKASGGPLTILSVAYPLLPASAGSGGGAEQILTLIDAGLTRAGHRSIVIAARGSMVTGELIETPAFEGDMTESVREHAQRIHRRQIEATLQRTHADLIHFHGLDFDTYQPANHSIPQLATLHLPLTWYPSHVFEQSTICLNCVSLHQAQTAHIQRPFEVVLNGIDLEECRVSASRKDYLLWLGRLCPEKGVHVALRVAHAQNLPMIVAGPVHPFQGHRAYFTEHVAPLLDDKRRYIGPVDAAEKSKLLANARCLLVPSLVAETSSLVAMEAIGSGTPVIAFRSGALPEVVDHGVTGFIVDSEEEMASAVSKTEEISSDACVSVAKSRFSAGRMVADYLELYFRIMMMRDFGIVTAPHSNL